MKYKHRSYAVLFYNFCLVNFFSSSYITLREYFLAHVVKFCEFLCMKFLEIIQTDLFLYMFKQNFFKSKILCKLCYCFVFKLENYNILLK